MRISALVLAMAGVGFGGHSQAQAGTYFYVVDSLAVDGAGRCPAIASAVASDFEALTGLTVTRTSCAQREDGLSDIRVTYAADAEALLVTTNAEETPEVNPGRFATRAACEAAVASEEAAFAAATGLQPVIAYCKPTNSVFPDSWLARIDSFGSAAQSPYYVGTSVSDAPLTGGLVGLKADVERLLVDHGKAVQWVDIKSSAGVHQITALVYGDGKTDLRGDSYAKVRDLAQCASERRQLDASFAAGAVGQSLTFCTRGLGGAYGVWGITVDSVLAYPSRSDESFASYEECDQSRQDVLDHYRTVRGEAVVGGLCTYERLWRRWNVNLISRPMP